MRDGLAILFLQPLFPAEVSKNSLRFIIRDRRDRDSIHGDL